MSRREKDIFDDIYTAASSVGFEITTWTDQEARPLRFKWCGIDPSLSRRVTEHHAKLTGYSYWRAACPQPNLVDIVKAVDSVEGLHCESAVESVEANVSPLLSYGRSLNVLNFRGLSGERVESSVSLRIVWFEGAE